MKLYRFSLFVALFSIRLICFADDQIQPEKSVQPESAMNEPGWFVKSKNQLVNNVENIYDNGDLSLILSGYAYHGRKTYTPEKIASFNEKAWGLGISKVLRNEKDNEEALQFLVLSDSHSKPQLNALYSYQWMQPLGSKLEAGIGYTAGLFSRTDIIGGMPFPAVLPLLTFGTREAKLIMTYIPRISASKGNGDVLYLGFRIGLK